MEAPTNSRPMFPREGLLDQLWHFATQGQGLRKGPPVLLEVLMGNRREIHYK